MRVVKILAAFGLIGGIIYLCPIPLLDLFALFVWIVCIPVMLLGLCGIINYETYQLVQSFPSSVRELRAAIDQYSNKLAAAEA